MAGDLAGRWCLTRAAADYCGAAVDGAISVNVAYRLVKTDGRCQKFGADPLDALCDVFDVAPGELLEYEGKARRRG
jgi:hypothetical protein